MAWVKDVDSLWNFIGYVVLRAPDRFPQEDNLPDDEQMNLARAFQELRKGVEIARAPSWPLGRVRTLNTLLDRSLEAYKGGDDIRGAHLLQDFQDKLFAAERPDA